MYRKNSFLILIIFASLICQSAFANVYTFKRACKLSLYGLGDLPPIEQLHHWEIFANLQRFTKPDGIQKVSYSEVSTDLLNVRSLESPESILQMLMPLAGKIHWPKHPYNTYEGTPFFDEPDSGHIDALFSSSKSMFIEPGGNLYSIKMPTNYPHPFSDQQKKLNMTAEMELAIQRGRLINAINQKLGEDRGLRALVDIMTFQDKTTGNGFSVRDLRPLQNGNYFVPAVSIPFIGAAIAEVNDQDFVSFWQKTYIESIARAKAVLLLRYGIQMKTPNPQNWLIEFDQDFFPTGRVFVRDTADAFFLLDIAKGLGFGEAIKIEDAAGVRTMSRLRPYFENSVMYFNHFEATIELQQEDLDIWHQAHDRAYVHHILRELGLAGAQLSLLELEQLLLSPVGQQALRNYSQQNGIFEVANDSDFLRQYRQ